LVRLDDARIQHILEVAGRLFAHYGYDKTTMDDIAREAGVAKGTLYLYWPSKEALFETLLFQTLRQVNVGFLERVEADPHGGTIGAIIRHGIAASFADPFVRALLTTQGRILGNYLRRASPRIAQWQWQLDSVLVAQLQQAGVIRADLSPEVATYLLSLITLGMMSAVEYYPPAVTPSPEVLADALADIVQRAFAPPDGGNSEAGKRVLRTYLQEADAVMAAYSMDRMRKEPDCGAAETASN
jgi:TetR/AcrR family acrAB operon transcriptional repressor